MINFPNSRISFSSLLLLVLAGCETAAPQTELPPPTVTVSRPIAREIADSVEFTGRTEAPFSVDIRARVTGYLIKIPFVEGSDVKEGSLLFEIDPRPYQAQVDATTAEVALNEATLKLAQADYVRAKKLGATNVAAISEQQLESYEAKADQSKASLMASKAKLESSTINLDFTKVTSPISGRISRYNLSIGNLVNADTTLLTTIVSEDPMYAYFDADEWTMLAVTRRLIGSKVDQLKAKKFPVFMGLADEEGYPHQGYVDFANNVVTASTGTITVRGVFQNPSYASGRRLLRPGMFVRIRLPISPLHRALLVTDRAVSTDQGRKFLDIVDADGVVAYREVKVGALQNGGLRVIEDGLKGDERVVVSGLQLVRPKMKVEVDEQPMPTTEDRVSAGLKASTRPKPAVSPKMEGGRRTTEEKNTGIKGGAPQKSQPSNGEGGGPRL